VNRRILTLLVAVLPILAFGVLVAAVTVPYVALGPGPTYDTLGEVERTLDAATKAVNLYQQILSDVAHNHATLEITDDGRIVATHFTDRKTSLH
jgi:PDZ domain-containing secreted protein